MSSETEKGASAPFFDVQVLAAFLLG
jgi:hypothetical protein